MVNSFEGKSPKIVFPSLNRKTFFNGVTSILINKKDIEEESKNDYNRMSRRILKESGVVRQKHCRAAKPLKKGQGKLVYTNGITLSEFKNFSLSELGSKSKSTYIRPIIT